MKVIALEEAGELKLRDIVKLVEAGEPVMVTQGSEGRFVLGLIDDFEWEVFSLSSNPEFMTYLDHCRERGKREGGVPLAEVRRQLVPEGGI